MSHLMLSMKERPDMGILRAVTSDTQRTDEQTGAKRPGQKELRVQSSEELEEGGGRSRMGWRSRGSPAPAGMKSRESMKKA